MIMNKKLQINLITLTLLCLGLCITSFAAAYTMVSYDVKNNYFHTGEIKINLNDGKAIIDERDPLFEPGMTIEKEFFIKNGGGEPIYYKLNFTGVSGELSKAIEVTILDTTRNELVSGKIYEFETVKELTGSLSSYERQDLIASFHFPENEGNEYKGKSLQFKMSAIAVQAKHNDPENPEFE